MKPEQKSTKQARKLIVLWTPDKKLFVAEWQHPAWRRVGPYYDAEKNALAALETLSES